jgi:hypothetical protein
VVGFASGHVSPRRVAGGSRTRRCFRIRGARRTLQFCSQQPRPNGKQDDVDRNDLRWDPRIKSPRRPAGSVGVVVGALRARAFAAPAAGKFFRSGAAGSRGSVCDVYLPPREIFVTCVTDQRHGQLLTLSQSKCNSRCANSPASQISIPAHDVFTTETADPRPAGGREPPSLLWTLSSLSRDPARRGSSRRRGPKGSPCRRDETEGEGFVFCLPPDGAASRKRRGETVHEYDVIPIFFSRREKLRRLSTRRNDLVSWRRPTQQEKRS